MKMNFADAVKEEKKWTLTENGAASLNTTGTALLDLFSTIGALRSRTKAEIETMVEKAYEEYPLYTLKCLFYARDVREGLGERDTFRIGLKYLANKHTEVVRKNIKLIGEYGRWDDIYCLVGTPCEDDMWSLVLHQLNEDIHNMNEGKPISLLAKWLKSVDTSSEESKRLGRLTAKKLGLINNREAGWKKYIPYRSYLGSLRSYIKIVEKNMCSNTWDEIKYDQVPSCAALKYKNAFLRHDEERYKEFISDVNAGLTKIHSGTLYPYNIIKKYVRRCSEDDTIEALWKNLPNYVAPGTNAIVMADTSGSMYCDDARPICSSVSLAIYFAERNVGAFHNMWMSFSSNPTWQILSGDTLCQKFYNIDMNCWSYNTDLYKAMKLVLDTAVNNSVPNEEMPKSIIIISDMEIDEFDRNRMTFYDKIEREFRQAGYEVPQVIFWNVASHSNVFHADSKCRGVLLCSGNSPATFKTLVNTASMTPVEYMFSVLDSERYANVLM